MNDVGERFKHNGGLIFDNDKPLNTIEVVEFLNFYNKLSLLYESKFKKQEEVIEKLDEIIGMYKSMVVLQDLQFENLVNDVADNLVDLVENSFLKCKYYSKPLLMCGVNTFGVCNNPKHCEDCEGTVQCEGFLCMDKVME